MKIDHIAIQVDDISVSVDLYVDKLGCCIEYCDDTWALLKFDNIKLALVIQQEHPNHIAFETNMLIHSDKNPVKVHRDGSSSMYIKDLSGNMIELIKYPKQTKHFADDFHEGDNYKVRDILYGKEQTKEN